MRIRTILAAAAAPLALGTVLLGTAGRASAATVPNPNSVITVTSQAQLDSLAAQGNGTITKNIDVPASVTQADNIWLSWTHVTGNITVEGYLSMSSDIIDGNVTVSGPGSFMKLDNYATHIHGNLTVTGSSGIYTGGPGTTSFGNWTQYAGADLPTAQSQVDGYLSFTGNSGGLYVGYPMHVSGKFIYSGNTGPVLDRGGLTVDGKQSVS
jgi:hypothetical protein